MDLSHRQRLRQKGQDFVSARIKRARAGTLGEKIRKPIAQRHVMDAQKSGSFGRRPSV
jgi:hypothetical protein